MRRKDREITDLAQIKDILSKARIVHLGLVDGDMPYVVPMHYGYELEGEKLTLYMHGAAEGRKNDVIARNPNAFIEIETGGTLIASGDVACDYSAAYRSVMGAGKACLVEDTEEKIRALKLLMRTQTDKEFTITAEMVATVTVIKVAVDWFTGKCRLKPKTGKRHPGAETLLKMSNQELFCALTGDYGIIAQANLQQILREYRAAHKGIDADLQTMVRTVLEEDAE